MLKKKITRTTRNKYKNESGKIEIIKEVGKENSSIYVEGSKPVVSTLITSLMVQLIKRNAYTVEELHEIVAIADYENGGIHESK